MVGAHLLTGVVRRPCILVHSYRASRDARTLSSLSTCSSVCKARCCSRSVESEQKEKSCSTAQRTHLREKPRWHRSKPGPPFCLPGSQASVTPLASCSCSSWEPPL